MFKIKWVLKIFDVTCKVVKVYYVLFEKIYTYFYMVNVKSL